MILEFLGAALVYSLFALCLVIVLAEVAIAVIDKAQDIKVAIQRRRK